MSFNQVFGGQNIFPSELTLLTLDMTADVQLQWPVEQAVAGADVFADIIRILSATGPLAINMPNATLAAPGQACLVDNVTASTITVEDFDGNTIGAVPSGEVWQFYLYDNTTDAGGWATFQFGTGVSSATAAALAGAGLVAIATTLNVRTLPETVGPGTPYTVLDADRAKTKIWTGGVGQFDFPDPATFGTSWMVWVRNSGSGDLTLSTAAAYINTSGVTEVVVPVGGSLLMVSAGTFWFTLAATSGVAGDFDFVAINVAGTGNYTLTGAELNRISYRLTGALTGNRNVIVPNTIQQYWVSNETSGSFTITVTTALGTGVTVPQGSAMILSSDGVNVVAWEGDPATGLIPTELGGTGLATYVQGDLIYATAADTLARLAKSAVATRYLANTGGSNAPNWDQINLANGVTGLLPFANFADLSATSVFGRATNSAGVGGSIAGTNNQVLRINSAGTLLEFGQVNLASAAAVTGVLPNGNGGTDQNTVAQGDLLYGIAGPAWARLTKHTTFKRPLMNTGTSNAPVWGPLEIFVQTPLAASFTLDADDSWVMQYESSGTTTIEIPANATVAFPVGTIIPVSNDAAAGGMTIDPLVGVTLNVQGQAVTTSFVIPPGYNGILWKVATDTWALMTDAPLAAGQGVLYAGFCTGSAGAAVAITPNSAASGWTVAQAAAGRFTVTHNLGLSAATDLAVVANVRLSAGGTDDRFCNITNETVNSFQVSIVDVGAGASDDDFYFTATRLV